MDTGATEAARRYRNGTSGRAGRWQGPRRIPTEPEYKVDLKMRGRWILGGHFLEVRGTWKGKAWSRPRWRFGSYDPVGKSTPVSGFDSDGGTWVLTATFTPGTSIETGTQTAPDGRLPHFGIRGL